MLSQLVYESMQSITFLQLQPSCVALQVKKHVKQEKGSNAPGIVSKEVSKCRSPGNALSTSRSVWRPWQLISLDLSFALEDSLGSKTKC